MFRTVAGVTAAGIALSSLVACGTGGGGEACAAGNRRNRRPGHQGAEEARGGTKTTMPGEKVKVAGRD